MTSIDEAGRLAALIKAQMENAGRQRLVAGRSSKGETSTQAGSVDAPASNSSVDPWTEIPAAVLSQVRALSPDDAPRKAFRLYLRASLARTLSPSGAGDASFDLLVDQVMDMMAADEKLSDSIQKAGRHLVDLASQP